jgi:uncharacterized protein (DUF1697 family)
LESSGRGANTFLALLRGINVGGRNKVPMAKLRESFEDLGYRNVRTFIASGNVIFESDNETDALTEEIQGALPEKFTLDDSFKVLVLTAGQLQQVIDQAPTGFGTDPRKYRYYVYFLMGISPLDAFKAFEVREGIDRIWQGGEVNYSRQLLAKLTRSRINKIASTPAYQSITIRSWNTATSLLELIGHTER